MLLDFVQKINKITLYPLGMIHVSFQWVNKTDHVISSPSHGVWGTMTIFLERPRQIVHLFNKWAMQRDHSNIDLVFLSQICSFLLLFKIKFCRNCWLKHYCGLSVVRHVRLDHLLLVVMFNSWLGPNIKKFTLSDTQIFWLVKL